MFFLFPPRPVTTETYSALPTENSRSSRLWLDPRTLFEGTSDGVRTRVTENLNVRSATSPDPVYCLCIRKHCCPRHGITTAYTLSICQPFSRHYLCEHLQGIAARMSSLAALRRAVASLAHMHQEYDEEGKVKFRPPGAMSTEEIVGTSTVNNFTICDT